MARPEAPQPDRYTGLPPGVQAGALGRRLAAWAIDLLVPALIALLTLALPAARAGGGSAGLTVLGLVLIGVWGVVLWWMYATRAAGPGMRLTKLQLVGFTDGRPIGWVRVLVRGLVLAALTVTGLGLLLMLVFLLRHPRHQGWHDLAGNAVVIRERTLAPRSRTSGSSAAPARPVAGRVPEAAGQAAAPEPAAPVGAPSRPAVDLGANPARSEPDAVRLAGPSTDRGTAVRTAVVPSREPAHRWAVVLDDGREIEVRGLVVLGRKPEARPGEDGAELVKLADESRTVSKSHLALDVDGRGLFLVDRGSTNGSTVTSPEGDAQRCAPGEPVHLQPGAVVSIGDHWLKVQQG